MANGAPGIPLGGPPPVPLHVHHGTHYEGELPGETRFDYLFRGLAPGDYLPKDNPNAMRGRLDALADTMTAKAPAADSRLPTIYTYWGQFVDHDLTLNTDHDAALTNINAEPFQVLEPEVVSVNLGNARLPQLNLDSVYGPGSLRGTVPGTMAVGTIVTAPGIPGQRIPPVADLEHDLPRSPQPQSDGTVVFAPLIADRRNDENLAIAQLHVAVLRFHNRAAEWVRAHEHRCGCGKGCHCGCPAPAPLTPVDVFARARELTRLSYQWATVHDYLVHVTNAGLVHDALTAPRLSVVDEQGVFMPLKFSVACFRFGHSMIRAAYDHNRNFGSDNFVADKATLGDLFLFTGNGGMRGLPALPFNWVVEWKRWVDPDTAVPNRHALRIDTRVSEPLAALPGPQATSLARRNLRRGYNLAIPTGQAVARLLGEQELSAAELKSGNDAKLHATFQTTTPLWFYVLKEAEVKAGGNSLGPVGGRIVAETIVGQVRADPASYLNRWWTPQDGVKLAGGRPVETIQDFLRFAGVLA